MTDDLFETYLNTGWDSASEYLRRALTDKSYRNVTNDHNLPHNQTLAMLGDAVLCLALCQILSIDVDDLTESKKRYETDETLVTRIASYYDVRKYLRFDEEDPNMQKGYIWNERDAKSQKFVATAVEAVLGAYYLDHNRSMDAVIPIVKKWMSIVDEMIPKGQS